MHPCVLVAYGLNPYSLGCSAGIGLIIGYILRDIMFIFQSCAATVLNYIYMVLFLVLVITNLKIVLIGRKMRYEFFFYKMAKIDSSVCAIYGVCFLSFTVRPIAPTCTIYAPVYGNHFRSVRFYDCETYTLEAKGLKRSFPGQEIPATNHIHTNITKYQHLFYCMISQWSNDDTNILQNNDRLLHLVLSAPL